MKALALFFLVLTTSLFSKEKTDFLFVGFDAGETHIWVQVLKNWDDAPQTQVLTMATASKVAKEAALENVIEIESLGFSCPASDRLHTFNSTELEKIEAFSASVLVTGMYSTPERQIAEVFAKKGAPVIAVWDNFSTYDKLPSDLVANVEKIVRIAHVILVPSLEIAQDMNRRFETDKAIPLGQPTLDIWEAKIAQVDKQVALAKTPLKTGLPILTYISGYEEKGNGYNDSFETFAKSLIVLERPAQVIIQLHPRSDGSFEKMTMLELASKNPAFPKFFISDGKALSTFEAVALGDLGICHRSTVAIQALFAGKRFMHVDLPGTSFSHFAIEKKLIPQCLSADAAAQYIAESLKTPMSASSLYDQAGIPPHATIFYRKYFKDLLRSKPGGHQNCTDSPSP